MPWMDLPLAGAAKLRPRLAQCHHMLPGAPARRPVPLLTQAAWSLPSSYLTLTLPPSSPPPSSVTALHNTPGPLNHCWTLPSLSFFTACSFFLLSRLPPLSFLPSAIAEGGRVREEKIPSTLLPSPASSHPHHWEGKDYSSHRTRPSIFHHRTWLGLLCNNKLPPSFRAFLDHIQRILFINLHRLIHPISPQSHHFVSESLPAASCSSSVSHPRSTTLIKTSLFDTWTIQVRSFNTRSSVFAVHLTLAVQYLVPCIGIIELLILFCLNVQSRSAGSAAEDLGSINTAFRYSNLTFHHPPLFVHNYPQSP